MLKKSTNDFSSDSEDDEPLINTKKKVEFYLFFLISKNPL